MSLEKKMESKENSLKLRSPDLKDLEEKLADLKKNLPNESGREQLLLELEGLLKLCGKTALEKILNFMKDYDPDVTVIVMNWIKKWIIQSTQDGSASIIEIFKHIKEDIDHVVDVLCAAFQDLPQDILKSLFLQVVLPETFSPLLDTHVRDKLVEIASKLIYTVKIADLTDEELKDFTYKSISIYTTTLYTLTKQKYNRWDDLWVLLVRFSANHLHVEMELANKLLRVIEYVFRNLPYEHRMKGFDCWIELIDNASLDKKHLSMPKKIKLFITPLKAKFSKTDVVICKRFDIFLYLMGKLQDECIVCLEEFLDFCFGAQGKSVPILWLKSVHALLAILGDQTFISQTLGRTVFEGPIIYEQNINSYYEVIISSVVEGSMFLCNLEMKNDEKLLTLNSLWNALIGILIKSNNQVQEKCFKLICTLLDKLLQHGKCEIIYMCLLDVFVKIPLEVVGFEIISGCIKEISKLTIQFTSENDVSSEFMEKYYALMQVACKYVDFNKSLWQGFSNVSSKNEKVALHVWIMVGQHIVGIDDDLTKDMNVFLWPIQCFSKFSKESAKRVCTEWVGLFQRTSVPTQKCIICELEKAFQKNPLLGTSIASVISGLAQTHSKLEMTLCSAIVKLTSTILCLPLLLTESAEKLFPLLIKCMQEIAENIEDLTDTDAVDQFCICLEKLPATVKKDSICEVVTEVIEKMGKRLKPDSLSTLKKFVGSIETKLKKNEYKETLTIQNANKGRSSRSRKTETTQPDSKINALQLFGKDVETMTPPKVRGSLLQSNSCPSNSSHRTRKILDSTKKHFPEPPVLEDCSGDFVVVDTKITLQKDKLTEHQKEEMKRRREDIPALYQDLTQETQNSSNTKDTSDWDSLKAHVKVEPHDLQITEDNKSPSTDLPETQSNTKQQNRTEQQRKSLIQKELQKITLDIVGSDEFRDLSRKRTRRSKEDKLKVGEREIVTNSTTTLDRDVVVTQEATTTNEISSNNRKNKLIKPKKFVSVPKPAATKSRRSKTIKEEISSTAQNDNETSASPSEITDLPIEKKSNAEGAPQAKRKQRQKDLMKNIQSQLKIANLNNLSGTNKKKGEKLIFIREIANAKGTKVSTAGLEKKKDSKSQNIAYTIEQPSASASSSMDINMETSNPDGSPKKNNEIVEPTSSTESKDLSTSRKPESESNSDLDVSVKESNNFQTTTITFNLQHLRRKKRDDKDSSSETSAELQIKQQQTENETTPSKLSKEESASELRTTRPTTPVDSTKRTLRKDNEMQRSRPVTPSKLIAEEPTFELRTNRPTTTVDSTKRSLRKDNEKQRGRPSTPSKLIAEEPTFELRTNRPTTPVDSVRRTLRKDNETQRSRPSTPAKFNAEELTSEIQRNCPMTPVKIKQIDMTAQANSKRKPNRDNETQRNRPSTPSEFKTEDPTSEPQNNVSMSPVDSTTEKSPKRKKNKDNESHPSKFDTEESTDEIGTTPVDSTIDLPVKKMQRSRPSTPSKLNTEETAFELRTNRPTKSADSIIETNSKRKLRHETQKSSDKQTHHLTTPDKINPPDSTPETPSKRTRSSTPLKCNIEDLLLRLERNRPTTSVKRTPLDSTTGTNSKGKQKAPNKSNTENPFSELQSNRPLNDVKMTQIDSTTDTNTKRNQKKDETQNRPSEFFDVNIEQPTETSENGSNIETPQPIASDVSVSRRQDVTTEINLRTKREAEETVDATVDTPAPKKSRVSPSRITKRDDSLQEASDCKKYPESEEIIEDSQASNTRNYSPSSNLNTTKEIKVQLVPVEPHANPDLIDDEVCTISETPCETIQTTKPVDSNQKTNWENVVEIEEINNVNDLPAACTTRSLPGSPLTEQTATLERELLDSTTDVSPIASHHVPDDNILRYLSEAIEEIGNKTLEYKNDTDESNKKARSKQHNDDKKTTETDNQEKKPPSTPARYSENVRANKLLNMVNVESMVTPPPGERAKKSSRSRRPPTPKNDKFFQMSSGIADEKPIRKNDAAETIGEEDWLMFTTEAPSPLATPSRSILKRKYSETDDLDAISPCPKRKRVSFSYPCITKTKHFFREKDEIDATFIKPTENLKTFEDLGVIDLEDETEESADLLDFNIQSKNPLYEPLINCKESLDVISKQLSSPLFRDKLKESFKKKNIETVGDLASINELEVDVFPIKKPKVKTMKKTLDAYFKKLNTNGIVDTPVEESSEEPISIECAPIITDEEVSMPKLDEEDFGSQLKLFLIEMKDQNLSLHNFGKIFVDTIDESEVVDLLKTTYQTDFTKFFDKSQLPRLMESQETSVLFDMFLSLTEKHPAFHDRLDALLQEKLEKTNTKDIIKKKGLLELQTALNDCISDKIFDQEDVVKTCCLPLIKSPEDIKFYFNKLKIIEVHHLVIDRIGHSDLNEFVDKLADHYGHTDVALCLKPDDFLTSCSTTQLVAELGKRDDHVSSIKEQLTKLGNHEQLLEIYNFVGNLLPFCDRVDNVLQFLQTNLKKS